MSEPSPDLMENLPCALMHGSCESILPILREQAVSLIYIDPPFNTGQTQKRDRVKMKESEYGVRSGYQGKKYNVEHIESPSYIDAHRDDYVESLLRNIEAGSRLLKPNGSIFVHLDYREVHYAKVAMDKLLGRQCFMNEIIWSYDYGARSKSRWSPKHNTILWYVRDPDNYIYNYDAIDRIPYMAPGLQTAERAALGKTPTTVWWNSIVGTNSAENTRYPTQKPLALLKRIVAVHSNAGDIVLDFYAGSGTTGEAALSLGRKAWLVDENPDAIEVMKRRLQQWLA